MPRKKKKSTKNKSPGTDRGQPLLKNIGSHNVDDSHPSVLNGSPITDPLACSFLSLQRDAVRGDLFELQIMLSELIRALETNNREGILGVLALVRGRSHVRDNLSSTQLRHEVETHCNSLKEAFQVFQDLQFAQVVSNDDQAATRLLKSFSAPKATFTKCKTK